MADLVGLVKCFWVRGSLLGLVKGDDFGIAVGRVLLLDCQFGWVWFVKCVGHGVFMVFVLVIWGSGVLIFGGLV